MKDKKPIKKGTSKLSSATAKKSTVKSASKKTVVSKVVKKKSPKAARDTKGEDKQLPVKYYEAVGRRKRAIARVRLFTRGKKDFVVNKKPYTKYFPTAELQHIADEALKKMKVVDKFSVSVLVRGGGMAGGFSQAPEARRISTPRSAQERAQKIRPQKSPKGSAMVKEINPEHSRGLS